MGLKNPRKPLQQACVAWAYEQVREAYTLVRRGERRAAMKRLDAAVDLVRAHDRTALPGLMEKAARLVGMLERKRR